MVSEIMEIILNLMEFNFVAHNSNTENDDPLPPLPNLNIAWIGDSNNILNSMLVTYPRLGLNLSVATPKNYNIEPDVLEFAQSTPGRVKIFNNPLDAVQDAHVLVTDTWVSMGQESEKGQRIKDFNGFQITEEMAKRGKAKPDWKFLHCLPRKSNEVDDEVALN